MYLVCLVLCKEKGSSSKSAITERRDMGLYEVLLSCVDGRSRYLYIVLDIYLHIVSTQ